MKKTTISQSSCPIIRKIYNQSSKTHFVNPLKNNQIDHVGSIDLVIKASPVPDNVGLIMIISLELNRKLLWRMLKFKNKNNEIVTYPLMWFFSIMQYQQDRLVFFLDKNRDVNDVGFEMELHTEEFATIRMYDKSDVNENLIDVYCVTVSNTSSKNSQKVDLFNIIKN
ncbi:MAG: hypothetical protein AABY22_13945, partial [Nanoarchaeota archaeon]